MKQRNTILCPATLTIGLLSSKWKVHILAHIGLKEGGIRFGELSRLLPEISRKMLTQSLNELVEDGFLTRKAYPQVPPKVVYNLTELGTEVQRVINALAVFGSKYINENRKKIERSYGTNKVEEQINTALKMGWLKI